MKNSAAAGILLIVANLLVMVFALYDNWEMFDILFIFWCENVIVGFWNILKIVLASKEPDDGKQTLPSKILTKIFMVPFFIVHYYGFCAGHGVVILFLFGDPLAARTGDIGYVFTASVDWSAAWVGISVIFLSHAISFVINYVGKKEYLLTDPGNAMVAPYKRVFLVHVFIIVGSLVIVKFGSGSAVLLVFFFILKILVDLWRHLAEHRVFLKHEIRN